MSKMDSNERDDVPLARLLKNDLFSTAGPIIVDVLVTLVHSDESSSFKDIFIPTPGQPSTTNEEIKQFSHSLPIKSPVQTSSPVDVQQSVPDPNPVGQSTKNVADVPVTLVHSDESSSFKDIFVPTPGQPSTTNEEIEQFSHSLPVKSPVHTSSSVDVQQSVPDPNHVGQSTENVGENIADNVGENPSANVDDHVEPTVNSASDDVVPNVNVPQTESEQPPTASKAKGKNHNKVVTTSLENWEEEDSTDYSICFH
ncbi:uncharacterized protein E5676_scaffold22G00470 [Cucumis melo var. makuwa]|uniref:Envelope-like protein n=1 Tax=Cucumis melo var. makuwa TaxID=1194695 RepID=A0A5D3DV57_CUCMM|nr:uncharacterized protein E6C27_scaffold24G004110 [Cucumis melo var. makuwa]TYK27573.1 uncharacterized protein E5676_scaffold22G00470 [Cucumis melo var. makuwa]